MTPAPTAGDLPFVALIDYAVPFPNVKGVPLWLCPNPLSPEQHDLLVEMHSRGRASIHLADYAAYSLEVVPALHHRIICEAIDDLLDDAYDDLLIFTPPGAAKSTYTSHALGSYYLGRYPERNVILATHTADLSEKWSRRVRNTIAGSNHQQVFPASSLSKDSTAVSRWATDRGGEFLAAGVGASILGFRADLAIIDDPISGFEQAQSITQLQKVHGWFETDLMTRLKPNAKTVLICQRLAANDLGGYIMARHEAAPTRRLKVVRLRMEVKPGDPADGTGRQPGERLWPEWFTQEMVEDAKRDDYKWRTLYQQEPPSEDGSWVSPDEIQFRPSPPMQNVEVCYGMSDLALSVNSGDYTVHLVVAIDRHGDWDIVDASRKRVDVEQSSTDIVAFCQTYRPREWLIDDDNASKVFAPLVATKARTLSVTVPWKTMPMRGQDKETRAAPLRGMFKRRKVYMPADAPWSKWFVKELLTFPNALGEGVDDGVDALGLLGRRLLALAKPAVVIPLPAKPTVQQMTLDGLWDTVPKRSRRI